MNTNLHKIQGIASGSRPVTGNWPGCLLWVTASAALATLSASALPPANLAADGGGGGASVAIAVADATSDGPEAKKVVITRLEKREGVDIDARNDSAWLGVGVEEAPESLAAQLQLRTGEGLVVTYVSTNSPAAKAGIKKNDVLSKIDDQLLVHPAQLRKLIQSRKAGDQIRITGYRRAEKLTVSAVLEKAPASLAMDGGAGIGGLMDRQVQVIHLNNGLERLHESLAKAGIDSADIAAEIRKSVEQAQKEAGVALDSVTNSRKIVIDALVASGGDGPGSGSVTNSKRIVINSHGKGGLDIDKKTRIFVTRNSGESQNLVRTDESGTYVLIANPKKQLTVHDKDGKLLFDGPIETEEDQAKVPAAVWEKAKGLVDQLKAPIKEGIHQVETQ